MSLATRCTACGTIFRVVQDQLKVSEGWVRCGRCREVFNALESLFDLEREAPPQRHAFAAAPSATERAQRAVEEFIASGHPPLDPDLQARLPATQEEDAIESRFLARPSAGAGREDDDEDDETDDPAHPDFVDARFPSELPLDAADDEEAPAERVEATEAAEEPTLSEPRASLRRRWSERRARREREAISSLFETSTGEMPEPGPSTSTLYELPPGVTPGFVRQAEDAERWRRPRVRASLVVAGLLLLGALAVQVSVHFRDTIVAHRPDARRALETLCEVMGCDIGPPRQLAALSVEASGLTEVEGTETYRLSLTLNNRAAVAIAAPAIELGLTDASGELIARRMLLPSEFRTAAGASVAGAAPLAPGTETQWQALLTAEGGRVSGYTVELFYP